jgi:hypothetical protein
MNNINFPPNIDPHTFSIIAVVVGYASVGNYTANEQNSIGNWLILVGQYMLTHAAQQQLIEGRRTQNKQNDIELIIDALKKMKDELEKIKNQK